MSTVAIIDYGSGNLRSAAKAFERAVLEEGLAQKILVTADPEAARQAGRIVLPGVGAFADCKRGLDAVPGMVEALEERVLKAGVPFLGICVGMQLLASQGHEHGDHQGLGWIEGEVDHIAPADAALKIPHMGWNELAFEPGAHPLLKGLSAGAHAYFVHSYAFKAKNPAHVLATVDYGGPVNALIGRDNIAGTQFHPEKSQKAGLCLIANFLKWTP
ncbi:MAG: imidazole glycerol phosphate synthase subunit HisH [Alphaproteobacteria bacterium]|nr:imidazole glycerol phosphate synthase subunit HisH [Alphaproteobacteria bacterium]